MRDAKNSSYYFEQAERCLRWGGLVSDARRRAELEAMAQECIDIGRRLQSMERATSHARVLSD